MQDILHYWIEYLIYIYLSSFHIVSVVMFYTQKNLERWAHNKYWLKKNERITKEDLNPWYLTSFPAFVITITQSKGCISDTQNNLFNVWIYHVIIVSGGFHDHLHKCQIH